MSSLSAHEKKEMKLAVMLMIVVVVFLICNILALITNILEVFFGEEILEVKYTLVPNAQFLQCNFPNVGPKGIVWANKHRMYLRSR